VSPGLYQISASRLPGPDGTPFDRFLDSKNSKKSVTVTDGGTISVELNLAP